MDNNAIIAIAFLLSKIALSSNGLSVAILRGQKIVSVRKENEKDLACNASWHSRMSGEASGRMCYNYMSPNTLDVLLDQLGKVWARIIHYDGKRSGS